MSWFDEPPSESADAVPHDAAPEPMPPQPAGIDPTRDPTSPIVACPNSCASRVYILGCQAVGVNQKIKLRASADCGPGSVMGTPGSFHWSTGSAKVSLSDVDKSTIIVTAGAQPSLGRAQEVITVDWSSADCSPLSATINLTVIDVIFSQSPPGTHGPFVETQYGYDDMDTPVRTDDHVSVEKLSPTLVHVDIKGGLNGNEIYFNTVDSAIATVDPAPAQPSFDLWVNGGDKDKDWTRLLASGCENSPTITQIYINVYKEKVVRAVVAKIWDKDHPATVLRFPNLDVRSAQNLINPKARAAVVRYELSDYSDTGGAVEIPYDIDGNGMLTWDIVNNGGKEFAVIQSNFNSSDQRIAVVREMVSVYYLDAEAAPPTTTIKLRGIDKNNFFSAGLPSTIGTGAGAENVTIQAVASANSDTVTLSAPLTKPHSAGETVTLPAAGWGGDPVIIREGPASEAWASEENIKWTFFHETGHQVLLLQDLLATESIMHFNRASWTDHRLRFKPLNRFYNPPGGTENQWESIPRR